MTNGLISHAPDQATTPASSHQANSLFKASLDRLAAAERPLERMFARLDQWLSHGLAWAVAVAAMMVLQACLIVGHRPWGDEWQALAIALQTPTFADLLANLRYEGHPPLWYLVLIAIRAVVNDPMWVLPVAAGLLAGVTQATILFAAPLRRADRLCIALSEFVMFEFLTLSRSLTLGVAVAILVIALWNRPRWSWLFIALLPQCDFLFGVLSVIFVALRWRERRMVWPMAVLWLVSGVVAAWTVRPMPDTVSDLPLIAKGFVMGPSIWLADMSTLALPLQFSFFVPTWNQPPPVGLNFVAFCALFGLIRHELRGRRDDLAAMAVLVGVIFGFGLFVYPLAIRHMMLAALLLILLIWRRALVDHIQPSVWARLWLLVAAACGILTATINMVEPFDSEDKAAAEIRHLGLTHAVWTAFPRYHVEGVAVLNAMTFERLQQSCAEDFMHWDYKADRSIKSLAGMYAVLSHKRDTIGRYYLSSLDDIPDQKGLIRKIETIQPGYDGFPYYFYVIGEDRPAAISRAPHCGRPARPLIATRPHELAAWVR